MKKFRFPLENVLNYKNQVLDALQAEHAALMAQVREQEEVVRHLEAEYCAYNEEYREKKSSGMTIMDAIKYESGLQSMANEIQREMRKLEEKKEKAEKKRTEVVEARLEATSIEKLKEKKLTDYRKTEAKDEERRIDEFISTTRGRAAGL